MPRKSVTFLRSFGVIGIMAIATPWDESVAGECWCGWGDAKTKTWNCRQLIESGAMAPFEPTWAETTCDSACKDMYSAIGKDYHFWSGYGDPIAQCKDAQKLLKQEGRAEGSYELHIDNTPDYYRSGIP